MRNLSDTIARLAAYRAGPASKPAGQVPSRLSPFADFGSNPGALLARTYLPPRLQDGAALVVVLHGCTQTAAGYDHGAGWSTLADRHGFALLFPEQQRANNANLCFNWFEPGDIRRGQGEALSISQMVEAITARHRLDRRRVFVTGLSAGGAMTTVMLATYPELFAGGAVIAGLPYGSAATIPEAFDRMRGHGFPDGERLQALLRGASSHEGPWPVLSVWHGSADRTVHPANAAAIIEQWRGIQGLAAEPDASEQVDGHRRRVWRSLEGRDLIEEYGIGGMGHGTPLADDGIGQPGPFMLRAGISSSQRIAGFWGLTPADAQIVQRSTVAAEPVPAGEELVGARPGTPADVQPAPAGVRKIIEDALRSAGLMR